MDLKVLDFLYEEVPSSVGDIRDALELLGVSIEGALDQVGEKVNKYFSEKDYKKVSELSVNSEELNCINKKIQEMIFELDSIIDKRNSEGIIEEKDEKDIPNYNEYLVNNKVEHTLYEDFTHKRPAGFSIQDNYIEANDWKNVLVETLNYLANLDKEIVENFVDDKKMNGKKVTYFAKNQVDIKRAPRKIQFADIYVETNQSSNSIRNLIIKVLAKYNINVNQYKIFLRADYSELH